MASMTVLDSNMPLADRPRGRALISGVDGADVVRMQSSSFDGLFVSLGRATGPEVPT